MWKSSACAGSLMVPSGSSSGTDVTTVSSARTPGTIFKRGSGESSASAYTAVALV
jgi:hypothetical protein